MVTVGMLQTAYKADYLQTIYRCLTTRKRIGGRLIAMKSHIVLKLALVGLLFLARTVVAAPTEIRAARVLSGHEGSTFSAYAPDGKTVVTTSEEGTVRFWNATTGQMTRQVNVNGRVCAAAFSPDGKLLALRGADGIKLLRADTGEFLRLVKGATEGIPQVVFSPDGRLLASGDSKRTVRVWVVATGALTYSFVGTTNHLVFGVAFMPDGKALVSGAGNGIYSAGDVTVWDLESGAHDASGAKRWIHSDEQVWSVAVTPDGSNVVYQTTQGKVSFLNARTGEPRREFNTGDDSRALAISPNGRLLAATARNTIKVWDLASSEWVETLVGHTNWVGSLAFSPDSKHLVSGSSDRTVRIWTCDLDPSFVLTDVVLESC